MTGIMPALKRNSATKAATPMTAEAHAHDQRPGRSPPQRQAIDHLRRGEPAVVLHRALVDVGQYRVSTAESQQRRLGEEPAHLGERAIPVELRGEQPNRRYPDSDPGRRITP